MFTVYYTFVPTCLLCTTPMYLHVYCVPHLCTYMFIVYYTCVSTCLLCTTLLYLHVYCVLHCCIYTFKSVCYTFVHPRIELAKKLSQLEQAPNLKLLDMITCRQLNPKFNLWLLNTCKKCILAIYNLIILLQSIGINYLSFHKFSTYNY